MKRWTFVIAYYNEAAFLPATLAALAAQTVPLDCSMGRRRSAWQNREL